MTIHIQKQKQRSPVADRVQAYIAITRPILVSLVEHIANEQLSLVGTNPKTLPLLNLGRLWKQSDGDIGNAFEYVVHDAVLRRDPVVMNRLDDALRLCKIRSGDPNSIYFAIEKQKKSSQLIATQLDLITDDSVVLSGERGRPVKLKRHLAGVTGNFYKSDSTPTLPSSIKGLWKADLIVGRPGEDHWVGTSIKTRPEQAKSAPGLRIGVVPSRASRNDKVYLDDHRNFVICPLPFDGSFMQFFYEGYRVVQALSQYDFKEPPPHILPDTAQREAARVYAERRQFTIEQIMEATAAFAQPQLLEPVEEQVASEFYNGDSSSEVTNLLSPDPLWR